MFSDGDVDGVFRLAWPSNQIAPMEPSAAEPVTEPIATEWSPPSTSGV